MHPLIKKCFNYNSRLSTPEILKRWKQATSNLCKPCWELKYCPYGQLVEDFPLLPITKKDAKEHIEYLKTCINNKKLGGGERLTLKRKKMFQDDLKWFEKVAFPESIPKILQEASCRVWGHICPVFLVAEPVTETKEVRTHSRLIPREVMIKVIRRDGQICQKCNMPVIDNEVEFDHIIPWSKGGKTTIDNLRLVHRKCNRHKSASLEDVLHPNPIENIFSYKVKK